MNGNISGDMFLNVIFMIGIAIIILFPIITYIIKGNIKDIQTLKNRSGFVFIGSALFDLFSKTKERRVEKGVVKRLLLVLTIVAFLYALFRWFISVGVIPSNL